MSRSTRYTERRYIECKADTKPETRSEKEATMSYMYSVLFSRIDGYKRAEPTSAKDATSFLQLLKDCARYHDDPEMTPGRLLAKAIAQMKAQECERQQVIQFSSRLEVPLFAKIH